MSSNTPTKNGGSSLSSAPPLLTTSGLPRTTEILWNGTTRLGFTLKRKRTGAILVHTLRAGADQSENLRVGSELRLVGGFPVNQLTLAEVKKVMLLAPKPVSLVFVNREEVVMMMDNCSFITDSSDDRKSFCNEFDQEESVDKTDAGKRTLSALEETDDDDRERDLPFTYSSSSVLTDTISSQTVSSRSIYGRSVSMDDMSAGSTTYNPYKKRKFSKLKVALERMNQLLNRPVRQSALNISAGRSIVV